MRARLVNRVSLPSEVKGIHPLPRGRWFVTWQDDPRQAVVLDGRFREVRRVPVPAFPDISAHALDPEGRLLALSCENSVRASGEGALGPVDWQQEHSSWRSFPPGSGACAFSLDGAELWATVRPGDNQDETDDEVDFYLDDDTDDPEGDDLDDGSHDAWGDECWVLDAATGQRLGRAFLGSEMSYSQILVHPDGQHMGVVVSEGQDGTFGYWLRRVGQSLVKTPTDLLGRRDRSPAAVSPDGRHYLNQGWSVLSTHAFPSAELITERHTADILPVGEPWHCSLDYYDSSTLLATRMDSSNAGPVAATVALRSPSLEPVGEIEYPEPAQPRAVVPAADGSWLTIRGNEIARWSFQ